MKKILINATQREELRLAVVDGQKLIDLDIEVPNLNSKKGNIYKGVITRVEPSLDAVFVDYGGNRHGFLPFKEISRSYLKDKNIPPSRHSFANSIREGQQVLVQIQREERSTKGATLTTYISLAGLYLVLMPDKRKAHGVSKRITGKNRDKAMESLAQLDTKPNEGVIARTAGVGHNVEDMRWDLDQLRKLWDAIVEASRGKPAPFLVYEEGNLVIRALRDRQLSDIGEIVLDNQKLYDTAKDFLESMRSQHATKLVLYEGDVPLFTSYQIEGLIETAYEREVKLPSGGSLVFDHTEALLSIDINSGKATKGSDIEETALTTNLNACEIIAQQLRLRDAGGLIVIDFIDMAYPENQKKVEESLSKATRADRARIQIGHISRFGLLEMSRQRLRPSLEDQSYSICPRCNGQGAIRTLSSSALHILRIIEKEAAKQLTGRVVAHLPIDVTNLLLNEKRAIISRIEELYKVKVTVLPDIRMSVPHFKITRYRSDDTEAQKKHSYEFTSPHEQHGELLERMAETSAPPRAKAAVETIKPDKMTPVRNFFSKLPGKLFSLFTGTKTASPPTAAGSTSGRTRRTQRSTSPRRPRSPDRSRQRGPSSRGRGQENGNHRRQSKAPRSDSSRPRAAAPERRTQKTSGDRPSPKRAVDKAAAKSATMPPVTTENPEPLKPEPAPPQAMQPTTTEENKPATTPQPQPAPMPKFSKPKNLTQVETKQH